MTVLPQQKYKKKNSLEQEQQTLHTRNNYDKLNFIYFTNGKRREMASEMKKKNG